MCDLVTHVIHVFNTLALLFILQGYVHVSLKIDCSGTALNTLHCGPSFEKKRDKGEKTH